MPFVPPGSLVATGSRHDQQDLVLSHLDAIAPQRRAPVTEWLAGGEGEATLVQRADHGPPAHDAVRERAAAMRAGRLHCVPAAVLAAEDRHRLVAHTRGASLPGRDVVHRAHAHGHAASSWGGPTRSGSPRSPNWRGWYGSSRSSHASRTAAFAIRKRSRSSAARSGSKIARLISSSPTRGTKS